MTNHNYYCMCHLQDTAYIMPVCTECIYIYIYIYIMNHNHYCMTNLQNPAYIMPVCTAFKFCELNIVNRNDKMLIYLK